MVIAATGTSTIGPHPAPPNPNKKNNNGSRPTSKTVWGNGKTERIDVGNPGGGKGNIHYHEPNNTKWYYDAAKNIFKYINGNPSPKRIFKLLKDPKIIKGINKALKYLNQ